MSRRVARFLLSDCIKEARRANIAINIDWRNNLQGSNVVSSLKPWACQRKCSARDGCRWLARRRREAKLRVVRST